MTFKGYLHIHSTYSYDGKVALADLKEGLKKDGVQFACITEHTDWFTKERCAAFFEECRQLSDESILLIPGLEVSFPDAHVILAGLPSPVDPQESPRALVERGYAMGAFVVFAHPHRSRFCAPEGVEKLLHGIEIWNSQYDGKACPRTAAWEYRDRLRMKYPSLLSTCGIDLHRWSHLPGPRLEVTAERLSVEAIMSALKQGQYQLRGADLIISPVEPFGARADQSALRRQSARTIWMIRVARSINAFLARFHLRLPKGFREQLRKRI